MTRVLSWLVTSVFVGVNLLALFALGTALMGHAKTAAQRRTLAVRCAAAAVGVFALSAVLCGVSISRSFAVDDIEPSERAKHLAQGISEAMNTLAFGVAGAALPFLAVVVLLVLARRSAGPS